MNAPNRSRPVVLVTDANRGSAIAIIRSLGRRGYRVVAADSKPHAAGFHSRYASERLRYPDPGTAADEYVLAVKEAVHKHAVDLVIPVTDDTILPLAQARAWFTRRARLAIAPSDALQRVSDKQATLALARELDVPVPTTHLVRSAEEARSVAHRMSWPVVLKPQRSRRLHPGSGIQATAGAAYANNVTELQEAMQRFAGQGPVLLQAYCYGAGEGVEMLAHQGQVLAAFQHRRLAEVPITGGASALRESVALDPELFAYSARLVEALKWTGLIMVEFKVGPNSAVLMEINGRVWGSLPLAVHSGMDFPARLAELYLSGPPAGQSAADTSYRLGVRACNLDLMSLWIGQVLLKRGSSTVPRPRRLQAVSALLGFLNPGRKYDVQTWRDPLPGLIQVGQIGAKLTRKARTRIRRAEPQTVPGHTI